RDRRRTDRRDLKKARRRCAIKNAGHEPWPALRRLNTDAGARRQLAHGENDEIPTFGPPGAPLSERSSERRALPEGPRWPERRTYPPGSRSMRGQFRRPAALSSRRPLSAPLLFAFAR